MPATSGDSSNDKTVPVLVRTGFKDSQEQSGWTEGCLTSVKRLKRLGWMAANSNRKTGQRLGERLANWQGRMQENLQTADEEHNQGHRGRPG